MNGLLCLVFNDLLDFTKYSTNCFHLVKPALILHYTFFGVFFILISYVVNLIRVIFLLFRILWTFTGFNIVSQLCFTWTSLVFFDNLKTTSSIYHHIVGCRCNIYHYFKKCNKGENSRRSILFILNPSLESILCSNGIN